jgi:hypothetical protein
MPVEHYIAMDTHSYTTDLCVKDAGQRPRPTAPGVPGQTR